MKQKKTKRWYLHLCLLLVVFLLCMPLLDADLSVEKLSPSAVNLCGIYPQNVTITAQNIQNTGNQTIENVTAILLSEPSNGGVSIVSSSLYLGSITPGILSVNPSWQVQCNDLPGVYTLHLNFSNTEGNLGSSQGEAVSTITVYANYNAPPSVLSYSPKGVIPTSYMTMEVVTNEDAICKYSTIPGVAYSNQQYTFQITGGKSHKVPLQNLVDNFYTYYVRCKDLSGNEAKSDYPVSVEINAPPTAMISLSKVSPLSLGTTEVTIATSEPVKPVPSLAYTCNGNSVSVPVTGSGSSWKGYIIISQANLNEVCSFSFSSTDLSGNAGSYIIGGNVFLIDTQPPSAPGSLAAVEQRGLQVKLTWKISPEEVKNFNIYRSSDESNDYSYHGTTTKTSFTDTVVSIGKTYNYHISAVDEAGNEGPVSEDVSVLIKGISLDAAVVSTENNEQSTAKVKLTLTEIDQTIAEADTLLDDFNTLRTKFKVDTEIFSVLGPSERIKKAKVLLLKKKEELGLLKNENLADENIQEEFQAIKDEIDRIRDTVISDIKTETEESFTAGAPEEQQLSRVIFSYLDTKNPSLSQEEKEEFLQSAKEVQSSIAVTATRQDVEVTYLNGTKKKLTFIRKEVKEKEAAVSSGAFSLLEYIPKELASSVDEMILGKEAEVIDPDPLLYYSVPEQGELKYTYLLQKQVDADNVAKTVTLAVPRFTPSTSAAASDDDSSKWDFLTGNAVVSIAEEISFYDLGIGLGIISMVVLFIYSLIYSEKEISLRVEHDLPSFDFIKKYIPKRKKKKVDEIGIVPTYYAHDEYTQAGLTPLFDSMPSMLLKKTEEALHVLDFEKAVKFYHLFCIQNEVSSGKKEKANRSSERIKQKMALLTKHTLLQYAVEKKEFMHLRQVLNEIAGLYNELFPEASEKEMRLLEHIKSSHAKHSAALMKRK